MAEEQRKGWPLRGRKNGAGVAAVLATGAGSATAIRELASASRRTIAWFGEGACGSA